MAVSPLARRQIAPQKDTASIARLRQHLDQRLLGMRVPRYSYWTHWRELADYILPRRYKWLITANQANRGSPINQHIIDSTGTIAARTLASGMMSGVTSPSRPWFRLGIEGQDLDDSSPAKLWLETVEKAMLRVFADSNYYQAKAVQYLDLAVFGTAPLIIYEDYEDVIHCFNPCAGEYYIENSNKNVANTLYREFSYTCTQVVQEFGLDNVSPTVSGLYRTGGANLSKEIIVAHAIEPNDETNFKVPEARGLPWREVYWEWGSSSERVLRIRGYHENPFSAPRWDLVSNDAYGRSPAMDALGDIRQLQQETKRKAQVIDKTANPPMVADVRLKNEPASTLPGGVTYAVQQGEGAAFKPAYQVNPKAIPALREDIEEVQNRIKTVFFNDLFLMISQLDTVRTATEIDARREEKLIQLGPVLERFENESLDKDIDRTFNIMMRVSRMEWAAGRPGMFPPPPDELAGAELKVTYISMLAEAQRAASTAAIERLLQVVGNMNAVWPEAADNIDVDETIDLYADMLHVSSKVVRATQAVAQLRQAKAQQAQAAQAAQESMAAVQGAQTLSKTDVGGGVNALQAMLGQGGASGAAQPGAMQ